MLHACSWCVFSILIPTPFPTPAFDFRAIGSFQGRSHSCPKAGSPRAQGPLSTAFCSEGYLSERGVVPGRRSRALWDQASSIGGRVWAECICTTAAGVAGRNVAEAAPCVASTPAPAPPGRKPIIPVLVASHPRAPARSHLQPDDYMLSGAPHGRSWH